MKKYLFALLFFVTGTLGAHNSLPWLHTKNDHFENEQNERVVLKGINLGGWLVEELWFLPITTEPNSGSQFPTITDHVSLWSVLEKRFGTKKMNKLQTAYRNAWLQEEDFARIAALGFNCIRLPFLYDLTNEPKGLFVWLDWAIQTAEKHGLYVILDMHGAPGRQSHMQHTGQLNYNKLFTDHAWQKKTNELWKKIATRYKHTSTVIGYDLLNEPMGAHGMEELCKLSLELYHTIRKEDKKHLIFIEDGYKKIYNIPSHIAKLDNVVLSTHAYAFHATTEEECLEHLNLLMDEVRDYQKKHAAAYYLGEFNIQPVGTVDTIKKFISGLEENEMSWSFWTYKVANHTLTGPSLSLWGIYTQQEDLQQINPYTDSLEEIFEKLESLSTDHFTLNSDLADFFKKGAR